MIQILTGDTNPGPVQFVVLAQLCRPWHNFLEYEMR